MKYVLFFLSFIILFGCQTLHESSLEQPNKTQNVVQKKIILDMLRGVIKSQVYIKSDNTWRYTLKVIDIASENLKEFSFNFSKKRFDVGDLVYIVFNKNKKNEIKDLYLIKKNYQEQKEQKFLPKKKRTKNRQTPWIGIPKTETLHVN